MEEWAVLFYTILQNYFGGECGHTTVEDISIHGNFNCILPPLNLNFNIK